MTWSIVSIDEERVILSLISQWDSIVCNNMTKNRDLVEVKMLSLMTTTVISALNSDHINSNYASMKIIMSSKSRRRLAIKTRSESSQVPTHPSDWDTETERDWIILFHHLTSIYQLPVRWDDLPPGLPGAIDKTNWLWIVECKKFLKRTALCCQSNHVRYFGFVFMLKKSLKILWCYKRCNKGVRIVRKMFTVFQFET